MYTYIYKHLFLCYGYEYTHTHTSNFLLKLFVQLNNIYHCAIMAVCREGRVDDYGSNFDIFEPNNFDGIYGL